MDARGEGDDVGVDGGAGDAIAALVERVASENEVTDRAGSRERGGRGGGARGMVANGEDDDGEDEQAWMADIDARMATVKDMEVKAVNGEYMEEDTSDADTPGQFDDLFEDRGETIVDLDESSLKTTSIMAFLETFALGPESLNGGRVTPTMGEILERVKARKPESLPEWTMTAAAAASAYKFAISKKRAADRAVAHAKDLKRKQAKLQAKADELASQLHVMQYGKTLDGKPIKAGQLKNLPHQTRPRGKMPAPPSKQVSELWKKAINADVCHVCGEGVPDWWHPSDEIVFCDGCDIQVHMSCYGLSELPEGDWYCRGCKEGVTKGPLISCGTPRGICTFCPHPGGALVRVSPASKWDMPWLPPGHHAHLACALHLPEVRVIRQKNGQAPMVDMSATKASRMNLKCSVCQEVGACTQCSMHKCFSAFHPLCARANEQITLRQAVSGQPMIFCSAHSAPEFEQQRFLTCGYNEDGTTDTAKHTSVFWGDNVTTDSRSKPIITMPPVPSILAPAAKPTQQEEKPKDVAVEAFPTATSLLAKRIVVMTLLRHTLSGVTAKEGNINSALTKVQDDCKQLDQDEIKRFNKIDTKAGETKVKDVLQQLDENSNKIPQDGAMYADQAPWKYLKSHQIDAVHWMRNLFAVGMSGILAFETGLGKRLTSLAFIQWVRDGIREPGQHLIVCPKETIHLWIADLHRWCTSLRSITLMSDEDEKSATNTSTLRSLSFDFVIIPYEHITETQATQELTFKSVIYDEWDDKRYAGESIQHLADLKTDSTFFLSNDVANPNVDVFASLMFPQLAKCPEMNAKHKHSKAYPGIWTELFVLKLNERMVEPPVVPAPLAKFFNFSLDVDSESLLSALAHVCKGIRKKGQKVLLLGTDDDDLARIIEAMRAAKIDHARIDEPGDKLGSILYAVARFNTMVPENNISFLICNVANLRRQQGLLSNVSTILFLDGEFSDKIDALGAPALENMWRAANRVWGLNPVKGTTNFMRLSDKRGKHIAWKKEKVDAEIKELSSCSEALASSVNAIIERMPVNGVVPPEFCAKDDELWDAAEERKQKRASATDPEWWTLHEHNCVYCGGVPGQCKNIPPAFLPPEKAGTKVRCKACPRVTSMGCAYIRSVPQKGWTCPQHSCLVCGKDSAPGHVTFRCVSCSRAFCDSCSSGAAFDAIADHPVWGPSGFTLPPYYEYVRCAICVDSLLKETTRARRGK